MSSGSSRGAGRGAPGRRRVPRAVREREMVEVATRLFAERGFGNTSMAVLASEAGITKPLLYSYFGSKEGLFAACATAAGQGLIEELRDVAGKPGLPPDQRLWLGLLRVFGFVERHRQAWSVLYPPGRQAGGPIGAGAAEAQDAMAGLLTELFEATGRESGMDEAAVEHVAPLAHGFTAATIAMASDWVEHRGHEPKELQALRLMNLSWLGFRGMLDGELWTPPPS